MTTPTEGFPAHLLTQPAADRLAYFTTKMVGHPRLKEVHQAVMQAMRQSAGAALFFVFGPTGVGKTSLRLRIEQQVLAEFLPTHAAQPGRVPIVGIEALAPESGCFNWKDYYMRVLRALHEPLVTDKIDYGIRGMRQNSAGQLVIGPSVVVAELRQALEQSLRHRQPTAVLIDEAQHLKKMTSGRRLLDQMDTLKSLASTTQTLHILIGTYEVLGLTDLSGQLSRRSSESHFARYRFDDPADRQMFLRVVYTFQRHLPLADEPDLVSRAEYLYERCVGCVGVLKTWLTQALAAALAEDAPTLTSRSWSVGHCLRAICSAWPARLRMGKRCSGSATSKRAICARYSAWMRLREHPYRVGGLPHGLRARLVSGNPRAILSGSCLMRSEPLTLYDLWDMTIPPTPAVSQLYHLAPIGLGTSDSESLTSYVVRLAQAHRVSVGALVVAEIRPQLGPAAARATYLKRLPMFWQRDVATVNGTSGTALAWVRALQVLTQRTDLMGLTMLRWAEVLAAVGLVRTTRMWCWSC
jgi:hypothetical protein